MANKPIKSIKYPGLPDTYTFVQIGTEAGQAADAKETGDRIGEIKTAVTSECGINSFAVDSYVKTWNIWDGTWGLTKTNPVTGVNASYLVCGPAIPVTAGQYYSFGILNNPLYPDTIKVVAVNWYDENNTRLSLIDVKPEGGYLRWVQAPTGAVKAVPFYNTNSGAISLSVEQVKSANIKWFFATRLFNMSNIDSANQYIISSDDWIPSFIVSQAYAKYTTTHIIYVGPAEINKNLREVLSKIESNGYPSETNRYEVRIRAGIYDIASYYTSTEKSAQDFKGLFVPNYVSLVGVDGREKTIIKWDGSNDAPNDNISTLNIRNNTSLKGLTVIGNNIRYVIHDDFANSQDVENVRHVEDCIFTGINTYRHIVYGSGSGVYGKSNWHFKNCIFEGDNLIAFMQHNVTNLSAPSFLEFENCRFYGAKNMVLQLASYNTGFTALNYATFYGCKFSTPAGTLGKIYMNEAEGQGIKYKISGYGNVLDEVTINNTDGADYSGYVDLI